MSKSDDNEKYDISWSSLEEFTEFIREEYKKEEFIHPMYFSKKGMEAADEALMDYFNKMMDDDISR